MPRPGMRLQSLRLRGRGRLDGRLTDARLGRGMEAALGRICRIQCIAEVGAYELAVEEAPATVAIATRQMQERGRCGTRARLGRGARVSRSPRRAFAPPGQARAWRPKLKTPVGRRKQRRDQRPGRLSLAQRSRPPQSSVWR